MTTTVGTDQLGFTLDPAHEAHEPREAHGGRRDGGRLLVSDGEAVPVESQFVELGAFLSPGDLLVVNTSATIPAALDARLPDGEPIVVHLSGALPGGLSLVEARQPHEGSTAPLRLGDSIGRLRSAAAPPTTVGKAAAAGPVDVELLAGGHARLLAPFADSERLWLAKVDVPTPIIDYANEHGRPIRYRHVPRDWPLACYQTVFAREPGSSEMPSASRPFTAEVVTDLVSRGILLVPLLLHTGVSSLEGGEQPYPERYRVPATTADAINATRRAGGRVVGAGTTVVRALATVTDEHGDVHAGEGWTEVVVTPDRPVASVDGLLTGWHEPESTHLMMLEAFAGRPALDAAYRAALGRGYLWHEFGDSHLILRDRVRS